MATRKAAKARKTTARATKRKSTRSTRPPAKPRESRELKEILMELGRQALTEGVKQVLEDHGVDPAIKVDMVLRPTRPKGGRKATKARQAVKRRNHSR